MPIAFTDLQALRNSYLNGLKNFLTDLLPLTPTLPSTPQTFLLIFLKFSWSHGSAQPPIAPHYQPNKAKCSFWCVELSTIQCPIFFCLLLCSPIALTFISSSLVGFTFPYSAFGPFAIPFPGEIGPCPFFKARNKCHLSTKFFLVSQSLSFPLAPLALCSSDPVL